MEGDLVISVAGSKGSRGRLTYGREGFTDNIKNIAGDVVSLSKQFNGNAVLIEVQGSPQFTSFRVMPDETQGQSMHRAKIELEWLKQKLG